MAQRNMTSPRSANTPGFNYEKVAAEATDQVLGPTGAVGDILYGLFVETNTGNITIKDGTTTLLTFTPPALGFYELNIVSVNGSFKISTAATTSCLCVGNFS